MDINDKIRHVSKELSEEQKFFYERWNPALKNMSPSLSRIKHLEERLSCLKVDSMSGVGLSGDH